MHISVIICTHNPSKFYLEQVACSLKTQTMPVANWELLVVDNNSTIMTQTWLDLSWHPNGRIIVEEKLGLSYARITGVKNAIYPLVVFVDDDNLLDCRYLENAFEFYKSHKQVGCFGGKSRPIFESTPPGWFFETGFKLGCQDFGDEPYISNFSISSFALTKFPEKAPIGTGMVIQKDVFMIYINEVALHPERLNLGRKGKSLSSAEDNDIILTIIKKGYEIAYVPNLIVNHLIPEKRYSKQYLQKMAYESNLTWVKVLYYHGICPWKTIMKFILPLKKLKSYINNRAWSSEKSYIKWKSACGLYQGLSEVGVLR